MKNLVNCDLAERFLKSGFWIRATRLDLKISGLFQDLLNRDFWKSLEIDLFMDFHDLWRFRKKNRGRRLWAIVYLSCSASVCVSLNMSGYIWIFMSASLTIYHSVNISMCRSLSIFKSIYLSIYLEVGKRKNSQTRNLDVNLFQQTNTR